MTTHNTSSDRTLMALLAADADAPAAGSDEAAQSLPTLDQRVDMFLRAVHGPAHVATPAARAAAREFILSAMAADLAERAAGDAVRPSPHAAGACPADARAEARPARGFADLLRGFASLAWPAAEGFAMRGARLAAVPLVALLVVGTVWTSLRDALPPGAPAERASSQSADAPQRTTRGLTGEAERAAAPQPQSRGGESEEALRQDISSAEAAVGPGHPDVAARLVALANLLDAQARYREAEALYKRALAIRERAFGADHSEVGETLDRLALVYAAQGRREEAEAAAQRARTILGNSQRR